ncbi:cell division protein FtsA [Lactobacillus sp. S2-2]|uniref:cell division protein FtsA n=1 Tax=Lactobacillus sp. S2-2 TaxID=2692917 RepID=UPI001F019B18|nr:cell division protein FtsA [Lactobacillus sp. S2-2]MCF6514857.1 cell division protein FtsA [Lactobacillus sp. S2-2]
MDESEMYIGLDIGTTSIKVIVAEKVNGQMNIIGVGNEKSQGISRGVIVDIDKASASIKKAANQAEEKTSIKIENVVAGIPANMMKIDHCNGMINLSDQSKEIDNNDVIKVSNAAIASNIPAEREIVDLLPEEFIVDGFDGIQDPRGMVGIKLEMKGRVITGPKTIIHNTKKAIEKAGLSIKYLISNSQAEGDFVLNEAEKDFGTILVDLGGGQASVSVFHDNELKYAETEQEGGEYITKDISAVLNTSIINAEKIKREYGFSDARQAQNENEFPVEVVGQSQTVNVSEKFLAEIIQARVDQIFSKLKDKLDKIRALDLPGGIVITGGCSSLPGIAQLAAESFNTNIRPYIPDQIGLRDPSYSLVLSIVEYTSKISEVELIVRSVVDKNSNIVDNVIRLENNNEKKGNSDKKNKENNEKKKKEDGIVKKVSKFFSGFFEE